MPAAPHRCALLVVGLLALPTLAQKFVPAREIKHDQPVFYSTALSPQGNLLVAANPDFREIHLADPHTGKWLRKFALAQAHRVAFLPDGRSLLAVSGRSIVQMDVTTGKQTQRLAAQPRDLTGLAVHPAGDRFLITNDVGQLQVHHLATGKTLRTIAVSESAIHAVDLSADGTRVVVGCNEGAQVFDLETGKSIAAYQPKRDAACNSVAFSPDGRTVASGHFGPHLHLWEVRTSQLRRKTQTSDHLVQRATFAPNGQSLAFHWNGFRMKVWDLTRDTTTEVGRRWPNYPHHIHWDRRNRFLIAALTGWEAHVFRIEASEAPAHKPMRPTSAWETLAKTEGEPAYEAMWSLALSEPGRKLLLSKVRERLLADKEQRERINGWLRDLDAEEFATREKASAALARRREELYPELQAAHRTTTSLEARRRLQRILGDGPAPAPRLLPERLQMLRAIEALEYAATPEADALLEELVKTELPELQGEARASQQRRKAIRDHKPEGAKRE